MKDYRELKVWQRSHGLTLGIYRASKTFPKDELFGLTSQTRRAAVSVPANIAEGCGRGTDPDFGRHLQIAMGSANELDYHMLLAHDLGMLHPDKYSPLNDSVTEVKRMLAALVRKVFPNR